MDNTNPYDQFDTEKAQYLKDNGYIPIDKAIAQEIMDRTPTDTEFIKQKGWTFVKRLQGNIYPYSTKYLLEKTPTELGQAFSKMIRSLKPDFSMIEHLQVLELKDGDTIVLKTQQVLSVEQHVIITECIGDTFKERNVKVLVLDDGMDIGVIRSKEGDESNGED